MRSTRLNGLSEATEDDVNVYDGDGNITEYMVSTGHSQEIRTIGTGCKERINDVELYGRTTSDENTKELEDDGIMKHDVTVKGRDFDSLTRDSSANETVTSDITYSVLAEGDGTYIEKLVQTKCHPQTCNVDNASGRDINLGINGKNEDHDEWINRGQQNDLAFMVKEFNDGYWDTDRYYELLGHEHENIINTIDSVMTYRTNDKKRSVTMNSNGDTKNVKNGAPFTIAPDGIGRSTRYRQKDSDVSFKGDKSSRGVNERIDGDVITSSQPGHTDISDEKSNESTRLNAKLVVEAKTHDTTPFSQYGRQETSTRRSIESDLSGIKLAENENEKENVIVIGVITGHAEDLDEIHHIGKHVVTGKCGQYSDSKNNKWGSTGDQPRQRSKNMTIDPGKELISIKRRIDPTEEPTKELIRNENKYCDGGAGDAAMGAPGGTKRKEDWRNENVCNGYSMPSKKVPPDISIEQSKRDNGVQNQEFTQRGSKVSKRDKGGQSSAFEKYHLPNFDNNEKGITQGRPGASRSEEIGRGSDQTSEGHESNSAGLRKNGAAVGAGQNTVRLQATDKRAREDFGSGQGLPLVIPSYLSSAHWGETKSGAEMNYIKHRTKKLFQVFEHGGAEAPSERTKDQKPDYSHEYRYPNLSEGVQRYEVSDPPVSMDGLHGPSDIGQSGFRNPLGGGPIFVSFTNMGLVLLLGVLCS